MIVEHEIDRQVVMTMTMWTRNGLSYDYIDLDLNERPRLHFSSTAQTKHGR